MKLKTFNLLTLPKQAGGGGSKIARVAFSKSGTINFNAAAGDLIDISEGKKVALSQDEDEPENWYFFIDDAQGYPLRKGYDKKGCLFNHATLVKQVVTSFELDENASHNFLIAGQPTIVKGDKTKYWGIIVKPKI